MTQRRSWQFLVEFIFKQDFVNDNFQASLTLFFMYLPNEKHSLFSKKVERNFGQFHLWKISYTNDELVFFCCFYIIHKSKVRISRKTFPSYEFKDWSIMMINCIIFVVEKLLFFSTNDNWKYQSDLQHSKLRKKCIKCWITRSVSESLIQIKIVTHWFFEYESKYL